MSGSDPAPRSAIVSCWGAAPPPGPSGASRLAGAPVQRAPRENFSLPFGAFGPWAAARAGKKRGVKGTPGRGDLRAGRQGLRAGAGLPRLLKARREAMAARDWR
jgi:hypothetical protein